LKIVYNFLNLPKQITKIGGGGGSLQFTYDASGRKWKKEGAGGKREYVLGMEYQDGRLEAIHGPDGRLASVHGFGYYRPEYWHTDHLGNVRLAFADKNNNGRIEIEDDPATPEDDTEIMQENHYYPFGMNQMGPWYEVVTPENKYQYNGKELNEELGLDWLDYGARWYDGAVGRWGQVDPMAERYHNFSPYHYTGNNPVIYIDVDGMYFTGDTTLLNEIAERLSRIGTEEAKAFLGVIERMREADVEFFINRTKSRETDGVGGETFFDADNNRLVLDVFKFVGGEHKYSEEARGLHELEHGRQFLDGEIDFLQDKRRTYGGPNYDQTDEEKAFEIQSIITNRELKPGQKPLDPKAKTREHYSNRTPFARRTSPEKARITAEQFKKQGIRYYSIYNYSLTEEQKKKRNKN
jgi:RHS repeat-associated protein